MNEALSRLDNAFASGPAREAGFIACAWMIVAILVGVAAQRTGIPLPYALWAIATALAPAAVTLALLPHVAEQWAQAFLTFIWLAFAAVATAATGGFESALAVTFALPPAFAMRVSSRAAASEATFFAVLGYAVAGLTANAHTALALGPLPACGAGISILTAGALTALSSIQVSAKPTVPAPVAAAAKPDLAELERERRRAVETVAAYRRRAAELAHEFRTPLNHIIGFADVMRQRLFGPMHERYGEYVDLIHTSGRNLLDLVNGLLDLSRLEAGRYPLEFEDFDFRFIAEEAVQLMQDDAAAKSITLNLESDEALPVRADARALRQILGNLLVNGLKFTPEGGAVTARLTMRGDRLVIEVQDTGPGIPVAERARLGNAFERGIAGLDVEGVGLGLSLVRALAEAHGGMLGFHEAPGGGALVRVSLPARQPNQAPLADLGR